MSEKQIHENIMYIQIRVLRNTKITMFSIFV